jgi:hypothetical protein
MSFSEEGESTGAEVGRARVESWLVLALRPTPPSVVSSEPYALGTWLQRTRATRLSALSTAPGALCAAAANSPSEMDADGMARTVGWRRFEAL